MFDLKTTNTDPSSQAQRPSDSNAQTINAYNNHVEEYINTTVKSMDQHQPEVKEWVDVALQTIPYSGHIFEIGSATPRDATYMRSKGYTVTCSDGTPGFVKSLQKRGETAILFNILNDNFPSRYNMIYANAVFPHLNPEELSLSLKKIHSALIDKGTLAFTIKYGTGDEWINEKFTDKRFTHYWQEDDLAKLLHETGFEIIFENSNVGKLPSHKWLNIVAKKL